MGASGANNTSLRRANTHDAEAGSHTKRKKTAFLLGGKAFAIGPRITPLPDSLKNDPIYQGDNSGAAILEKQLAAEKDQAIQYRTCSWQKAAALLFSEYISLGVMSFPFAYATLGLFPGLVLTFTIAGITSYTSLILWETCLRHPEVRDVCDIGQIIFWGKEWAWWATMVMFVLNNTFVQGAHVVVGAQYMNTMTDSIHVGGCRTVQFSVIITIAGWLISLPRTFRVLSKLGSFAAVCAFLSVFLAVIFAGVQGKPAGYDPLVRGEPIVSAWPSRSTTFVQAMSSCLSMSFTFFGQVALPSFIAEMRDPRYAVVSPLIHPSRANELCSEFPKSLWVCTIAETLTFSIVGTVIYVFSGNQYVGSPAFSSLHDLYKKISFSFFLPTVVFLGCLYASVTTRFIFFRLFRETRHISHHTLVGWASWSSILLGLWGSAFVISQVIPFFSSLLSVISALFNSWFGMIFWGIAFFRMRRADRDIGQFDSRLSDYTLQALGIFIIGVGLFYLGAGTYSSVQSILDAFAAGDVNGVFQCKSNGL